MKLGGLQIKKAMIRWCHRLLISRCGESRYRGKRDVNNLILLAQLLTFSSPRNHPQKFTLANLQHRLCPIIQCDRMVDIGQCLSITAYTALLN